MKLSECRIGEVVQNRIDKRIGHIVGLAKNSTGETIPKVCYPKDCHMDLPDCFTVGCHHDNLQKLED